MRRFLLALAAALSAGCAGMRAAPPPTVVFLTDFGIQDDSVALCKGVMIGIEPRLRIIDLTHQAPVFDVRAAARLLDGAARYFPSGTTFVIVVDPGVGTERKAVAVRTKAGKVYIAPDNGVLTWVLDREGLDEAYVIENPEVMLNSVSSTFHGRDIFSPAGAHAAAGKPLAEFGPAAGLLIRLKPIEPKMESGALLGIVDFVEKPFGNVITNIPAEWVREAGFKPGDRLQVVIGAQMFDLPFLKTFGDVAVGEELALFSSRGRFSLSVNQGDFARRYGLAAGQPVKVRKIQ